MSGSIPRARIAAMTTDRLLTIHYGVAEPAPAAPGVAPVPGSPLRLWDGPYPFAEPPDLIRVTGVVDRLDTLRDHLQSLCGLWAGHQRAFLAAYFRWIGSVLAANRAAIEAQAEGGGGLFQASDWSFAAFRPLPSAHLPAGAGGTLRADIGFWNGERLVAVELIGGGTLRAKRLRELDALREAGVALVEIPAAGLEPDGAALLAQYLPPEFQRFWRGIALPRSPFGSAALAAILPPG
jgi:hypothetical protein